MLQVGDLVLSSTCYDVAATLIHESAACERPARTVHSATAALDD
jgi:hypothetical protein